MFIFFLSDTTFQKPKNLTEPKFFSDHARENFHRQILYTLEIYNITIEDAGIYKLQITYVEKEKGHPVNGTFILHVNGKVSIV